MKARESERLFNRLNSVSDAERIHACPRDKLSLDDAINSAVIEQTEALIDRIWANELYLSRPLASCGHPDRVLG